MRAAALRSAVAASLLLAAAGVQADVMIKAKVESGGLKGLGAFGGTVTRSLQGDKAREESDIDFKGGLMRAVTAARDGIEIVRIDLDKIWTLRPKKKTYTERTVSLPPPEKSEAAGKPETNEPAAADEKPTHRVKKTDFTVTKTGQKKTVNGFSTEESQIRLLVEIEEIATKEVTTSQLVTAVWVTPWTAELRKASAEEAAFALAYAKKLGIRLTPDQRRLFDPTVVALMLGVDPAKAEDLLSQAKRKMETINGYPIVVDARWSVTEDSKAVARRQSEAKAAAPEEEGLDLSGGAANAAGNLLGGFAKKKMKANQEKKAAEREKLPAFSTYHEVLSVSTEKISSEAFNVPAGYKKISR